MKRSRLWSSILLAPIVLALAGAAVGQGLAPIASAPVADIRLLSQPESNGSSQSFAAAPPAATPEPQLRPARPPVGPADSTPTATPEPQLRPAPPQAGTRDPVNTFDPSITTWVGPETPPEENWAAWGGTDYAPRPAYSGIGGSGQGGFWQGGSLRMFFFGNGAYGSYLRTGAQELCRGFDDWCPPVADGAPAYGAQVFTAYDLFRQIPDGQSRPHGNNGSVNGFNLAAPLPWLDQFGMGGQLGMSYGTYNYTHDTQQQVFVTAGIFRRATADRPISFGIVYDGMFNDGFGAFQTSPSFGQLRSQVAYAFTARDEIGIWGAMRTGSAERNVAGGPVAYRGISQGNVFWHHKFGAGRADGWVWAGLPDVKRLNGDNSYETTLIGGRFDIPLNNSISLFSSLQATRFKAPSPAAFPSTPTAGVSNEPLYAWMIGFTYYPGATARSSTVAGRSWMPYMPVANNGSFLIDTNRVP